QRPHTRGNEGGRVYARDYDLLSRAALRRTADASLSRQRRCAFSQRQWARSRCLAVYGEGWCEESDMKRSIRGFTLIELTIALVLLALLSAVLYGSLGLAGTSLDRGEAKADATSGMRLAHAFLRANLEEQHPLRMRKIAEFPLLFSGDRDELRYAAPLPPRVAGGGIYFYRLAVLHNDARAPLVLERALPDVNASEAPE